MQAHSIPRRMIHRMFLAARYCTVLLQRKAVLHLVLLCCSCVLVHDRGTSFPARPERPTGRYSSSLENEEARQGLPYINPVARKSLFSCATLFGMMSRPTARRLSHRQLRLAAVCFLFTAVQLRAHGRRLSTLPGWVE